METKCKDLFWGEVDLTYKLCSTYSCTQLIRIFEKKKAPNLSCSNELINPTLTSLEIFIPLLVSTTIQVKYLINFRCHNGAYFLLPPKSGTIR